MRAFVLTGHGGPEAQEWRTDWPDPVAGPGEVLVRVGACGLNNTDIWTREGRYAAEPDAAAGWRGAPLAFPRIQGADICGRIVAVGAGVRAERIGERVLVNPVVYGPEGDGLDDYDFLGSERDGGFADLVTIPAVNAVAIDTSLADAELATFPTAYLTAEHMLARARVGAGERVLVTGASGGVGSALVQLAALRGATVIAMVGPGKAAAARDLGAACVVPRESADLAAAIGGPVDVAADVVGGAGFPAVLAALRPGGRYVTAGAIAGPHVALDLRTLYLKRLDLIGSTLGTREEFLAIVGHIAAGRLRPLLAGSYSLADLPRAQTDFLQKRLFGKLVVVT
jgi:NADPH:quinone reductase-like Zn-dependent oxidoreductase